MEATKIVFSSGNKEAMEIVYKYIPLSKSRISIVKDRCVLEIIGEQFSKLILKLFFDYGFEFECEKIEIGEY